MDESSKSSHARRGVVKGKVEVVDVAGELCVCEPGENRPGEEEWEESLAGEKYARGAAAAVALGGVEEDERGLLGRRLGGVPLVETLRLATARGERGPGFVA